MHDNIQEILDGVKLHKDKTDESAETVWSFTMMISNSDLFDLTTFILNLDLQDEDDFRFWFQKLSVNEHLKLYYILDAGSVNKDVRPLLSESCKISMKLVRRIHKAPCLIDLGFEEGENWITYLISTLGIIISRDEFDELHKRSHEIIDKIDSAFVERNYMGTIHEN